MVFDDIDQAQREASSSVLTEKRGKKRKNATIARLSSTTLAATAPISPAHVTTPVEEPESANGLRSGRWTEEETYYCDKLIELFERGQLPIPNGIKLNDFLSGMLKSKQSRLTKKMKNARLSARMYKREDKNILTADVAIEVSKSEVDFFESIKCTMERSEIRFHMQREWRELFTSYCTSIGQTVDAYEWMKSDEELDRRVSIQLDAARLARRKIMMGLALEKDTQSTTAGVFIDTDVSSSNILSIQEPNRSASPSNSLSVKNVNNTTGLVSNAKKLDKVRYYSSSFIKKVLQFLQRHGLPFEFCDIWVPSFTVGNNNVNSGTSSAQNCRLFFAGFGVTEYLVPENNDGPAQSMSSEEFFDYLSFGEYSGKFSFDVGCGLPGRVYTSGVASWEQNIQNAPKEKFERKGGAEQWGIHTALGIPISSPSVERIVAVFYSKFHRVENLDLVDRLCTEISSVSVRKKLCCSVRLPLLIPSLFAISQLMPTPRWHLVVDVGAATIPWHTENREDTQKQIDLLRLLEVYMPKNKNSPLSLFLPGFTSLRLLLVKHEKSAKDLELLHSILGSYDAYVQAGRSDSDVIAMTARDFMFLTKHGRTDCESDYSNNNATKLFKPHSVDSSAGSQSRLAQLRLTQNEYHQSNMPAQHRLVPPPQLPLEANHTMLRSPFSPSQFQGNEVLRSNIPSPLANRQQPVNMQLRGKVNVTETQSLGQSFGAYQASGNDILGNVSPLMFDMPLQHDNFGFFVHDNNEKYF
jgi:hypothetical protein